MRNAVIPEQKYVLLHKYIATFIVCFSHSQRLHKREPIGQVVILYHTSKQKSQ